jgi:hypothetical protein
MIYSTAAYHYQGYLCVLLLFMLHLALLSSMTWNSIEGNIQQQNKKKSFKQWKSSSCLSDYHNIKYSWIFFVLLPVVFYFSADRLNDWFKKRDLDCIMHIFLLLLLLLETLITNIFNKTIISFFFFERKFERIVKSKEFPIPKISIFSIFNMGP